MQLMAADTNLMIDGSNTKELHSRGVQYYQGILLLDLARLQENLECDSPPQEDVEAVAGFLGIHHDESPFIKEVWVLCRSVADYPGRLTPLLPILAACDAERTE